MATWHFGTHSINTDHNCWGPLQYPHSWRNRWISIGVPGREIEPGPAVQQADALLSELRRTLSELRRTLLSYDAPTELAPILLSYAEPYRATPHPRSYAVEISRILKLSFCLAGAVRVPNWWRLPAGHDHRVQGAQATPQDFPHVMQ